MNKLNEVLKQYEKDIVKISLKSIGLLFLSSVLLSVLASIMQLPIIASLALCLFNGFFIAIKYSAVKVKELDKLYHDKVKEALKQLTVRDKE